MRADLLLRSTLFSPPLRSPRISGARRTWLRTWLNTAVWALSALSVLSLTACGSLNPFSDAAPQMAPPVELSGENRLSLAWQLNVGDSGAYVFRPAVVGDRVFAAAHDGKVFAIEDGRTLWRASAGKRLSAGVGSDGRLVVVAATNGEVIGLDASNGELRWATQVSSEVLAPPEVSERVVVVRSADSRLIGLNPQTGERLWNYARPTPALALRSFSGLLLDAEIAVAGYPGGRIAAVQVGNGAALWDLTVALPRGATELERVTDVVGVPVLAGNALCAAAYQGRIACFDPQNGATRWGRPFSSVRGLDHDGRILFATDDADALHAFAVEGGASLWKRDGMQFRQLSRPLVLSRHVVVADGEGYVYLMQRDDGQLVGRQRIDSSPVRADPQRLGAGFVLQSHNGTLAAYQPN